MTSSQHNPLLQAYFDEYAKYHRTLGNQLTHYIGIPLIVMSLLGLLAQLQFIWTAPSTLEIVRLDAGRLLWLGAAAFYFALDWKLAFPFSVIAILLYHAGATFSNSTLWTLFIIGWILQFIGHWAFEKRSPAFADNLLHLLIGPLWIYAKAARQA